MRQMLAALTLLTLLMLAGCHSSGGDAEIGVPTTAGAAESPPDDANNGVAVESAVVSIQPSYVKGAGPDWVVDVVGNNLEGPLDGIQYTVELRGKSGSLFAKHGTQLYFTPKVEGGAVMNWTARVPVGEKHPDAEGVTAHVMVQQRLLKEDMVKQTWQPLDPNNLPPARKVTLDAQGNAVDG